MSANTTAQNIPIRRIQVGHPSEIPNDYGTTPGGTLFSTTPGGTRIIYDRLFLLKCRDSPLSKTPPANLPDIPGVTTPDRSPAKHVIGKIAEENGEAGIQRYRKPYACPFPSAFDAANHNHLQVPDSFPMKPSCGGPLAQYRRRQSLSQMKQDCYVGPPQFFNNFPPPPFDPQYRGIFSPPPIPMGSPFTPPPLFVHPMQGPAGPIFDQRPMQQTSQLAMWRRSHSRTSSSEVQAYSTAKAPQLRSSFSDAECFSPEAGYYGRGRGFRPLPPIDHSMARSNCGRRISSVDSAYDSSFNDNDLVMVIPDDPSIIAYKPLQKPRMDKNASFMPPFSPVPTMGV